ncbi:MAG: HD domain-containing protein [Cetobacterium sp.]
MERVQELDLKNHMIRVAEYAEIMGNLLYLDNREIKLLKKGALFHDIGKILVDKDILNKSSQLTKEEFEKVKEHSSLGLKVLNEEYKNEVIENIILFHHEKWNGKGYPLGLTGKNIPLEARIVSVVDCYDALTSKRAYKNKMSHEEALKILKEESGICFDPDIISIFELFENKFRQMLSKY